MSILFGVSLPFFFHFRRILISLKYGGKMAAFVENNLITENLINLEKVILIE